MSVSNCHLTHVLVLTEKTVRMVDAVGTDVVYRYVCQNSVQLEILIHAVPRASPARVVDAPELIAHRVKVVVRQRTATLEFSIMTTAVTVVAHVLTTAKNSTTIPVAKRKLARVHVVQIRIAAPKVRALTSVILQASPVAIRA